MVLNYGFLTKINTLLKEKGLIIGLFLCPAITCQLITNSTELLIKQDETYMNILNKIKNKLIDLILSLYKVIKSLLIALWDFIKDLWVIVSKWVD